MNTETKREQFTAYNFTGAVSRKFTSHILLGL